jgi:hypothetical protein
MLATLLHGIEAAAWLDELPNLGRPIIDATN